VLFSSCKINKIFLKYTYIPVFFLTLLTNLVEMRNKIIFYVDDISSVMALRLKENKKKEADRHGLFLFVNMLVCVY